MAARKESRNNSQNSSLNFNSEHQYDTLSLNFGKKKYIKSIGSQMNQKQPSHYDMLSVASVISKGSKVLAPTNANEQNEKPLPKQSKFQMSHFEDS